MRIRLSVNDRLMRNLLANDMIFGVERLETFGPVRN
jgi:hypothetical protein